MLEYRAECYYVNYDNTLYAYCYDYCHKSALIYNSALYIQRHRFFSGDNIYSKFDLIKHVRNDYNSNYYSFNPCTIANATIFEVCDNFKSFFESIKDFKLCPSKYKGRPNLPKYIKGKHKLFPVEVPINGISETVFKQSGKVGLHDSPLSIKFNNIDKYEDIKTFNIVPVNGMFKITVVYLKEYAEAKSLNQDNIMAIDLGVQNIFAITTNTHGFQPILVKGSDIIKYNQGYNKNIGKCQSKLKHRYYDEQRRINYNEIFDDINVKCGSETYLVNEDNKQFIYRFCDESYLKGKDYHLVSQTDEYEYIEIIKNDYTYSKHMNRMTLNRAKYFNDVAYKLGHLVIDLCKGNDIGTLIIGKNDGWKQDVNLGKKTNQKFVNIPHSKFINTIKYLCKNNGITCITQKESYTSKCSFLDLEDICHHKDYMGKRKTRDLFISKEGYKLNADINASYNIMRKYYPNIFIKNAQTGHIMMNNKECDVEVRLDHIKYLLSGNKITTNRYEVEAEY